MKKLLIVSILFGMFSFVGTSNAEIQTICPLTVNNGDVYVPDATWGDTGAIMASLIFAPITEQVLVGKKAAMPASVAYALGFKHVDVVYIAKDGSSTASGVYQVMDSAFYFDSLVQKVRAHGVKKTDQVLTFFDKSVLNEEVKRTLVQLYESKDLCKKAKNGRMSQRSYNEVAAIIADKIIAENQ